MSLGECECLLGSRIGHGCNPAEIWTTVEAKIDAKLAKFEKFGLSVFGRALLVNSCIFSHLWYAASFTACSVEKLEKFWKRAMHFVFADSPGIFHPSFRSCRLPRRDGGLGILDPVLQSSAIRATWISRMLFSEDAPWRHLLWAMLTKTAECCGPSTDILGFQWHLLPARCRDPSLQFYFDILRSFASLEPKGVPPPGVPSFPFVLSPSVTHHFFRLPPSLPSTLDSSSISVCDGVRLEKLTVKTAYLFLLRRDLERLPLTASPLALPCPSLWSKRWRWLNASLLPQPVRQLMWRRWHNKLYMGETKDTPSPLCPFCPRRTLASALHSFKDCSLALAARELLQECWLLWTGSRFDTTWWDNEYSPNAAWMACFSFMLHALYVARVRVVTDDLDAKDARVAVAHRFRASVDSFVHSLCWFYRFEHSRRLDERLKLGGAWLKEPSPSFLTFCVSWPGPPF